MLLGVPVLGISEGAGLGPGDSVGNIPEGFALGSTEGKIPLG
jgi:hypothetical protein